MAQSQSTSPAMHGYTKLASLMGQHPETAIFRRFGTLNAQNLLYYQAELVHLEQKLKQCSKADLDSNHQDRSIYDRDWQTLSGSPDAPDGNPEQWNTILAIRKVLKEYNEALMLQTFITKQGTPNLRDWRHLEDLPNTESVHLLGADSDVWKMSNFTDLISVGGREDQSMIHYLLSEYVVRWWSHCLVRRSRKLDGTDIHGNTVHHSHHALVRLSAVGGTICASVLPVLAVVVLYYVHSMSKRLAIIGVFTTLFSIALSIFTNGRVIEIFSATAAFSAVLVVFVGTTSGSSGV